MWLRAFRLVHYEEELASLLPEMPEELQRAVVRSKEGKTGGWLTVMPTEKSGNLLSAQEFRDGLALRYSREPNDLPSICDGCGAKFSVEHALDCKRGGLITQRHNEVRDELAHLSVLAYGDRNVSKEPVVCEGELAEERDASDEKEIERGRGVGGRGRGGGGEGKGKEVLNGLRGDLRVRGLFERQTDAIFDIRVKNTDAPSYRQKAVAKVLEEDEKDKKRKYLKECLARRLHFVPFVCSVDGVFAREATSFLKRLAGNLAEKWHKPYSETMGFVRGRVGMAIVRATNVCLRGARRSVYERDNRVFMEGGAGLELHM